MSKPPLLILGLSLPTDVQHTPQLWLRVDVLRAKDHATTNVKLESKQELEPEAQQSWSDQRLSEPHNPPGGFGVYYCICRDP